jgi:cytochrome b6-f complex iron-sulfur subunit
MAEEECNACRCPLWVDRRSVLRGGAALAVAAVLAEGCITSETVDVDHPGSTAGAGGATSSAGSGGQREMGGGLGGSGGSGTGDVAGASGAGGAEDAGVAGGHRGGGGAIAKPDGGGVDASGLLADCPSAPITGTAKSVAMGALVSLGSGVVVGRDAGGLYAMSSVCTHQGCGMNIVGAAPRASLHCPCHGSSFSATGAVTNGPARAPLIHFELQVSPSGDLAVCPNAIVASTTRTPG